MKKLSQNNKGFTLIELLVVVLIIGILAGVLISVINPAQQQDRAADGNVKAVINKTILSTQTFTIGYVRAPNGAEFLAGLQNACPGGSMQADGTCSASAFSALIGCGAAFSHCLFEIYNQPLPANCSANAWNGTGSSQCYFRYERVGAVTSTQYRIYAKSFGLANTVFQYDSSTPGTIEECSPSTSVPC